MSDPTPTPQFEDEIRTAVAIPPAREEFVQNLQERIRSQATAAPRRYHPGYWRPAWAAVFVIALLEIAILAVGPQRVAAGVRRMLGYLPGVGIVDQSVSIRVLAEPVTVARDGMSITVTSATLTGDRTHIEYRIFGVPGSAYPDREDVVGCMTAPYLRLADGSQLSQINNDFQPVPANINEATLVIPCIFGTLPGKAPENWELSLRFVPAPPDMTVMPVIELSPSPSLTQPAAAIPGSTGGTPPLQAVETPTALLTSTLTVLKEIETTDGYILVGELPAQIQPGGGVQLNGNAEIVDAAGKKVNYSVPLDVGPDALGLDPAGSYWYAQFKAAGLDYPLTITFSGAVIQQKGPGASAEFTFDAGPNPQMGQEWTPNLEIPLAGHSL